MLSLADGFWSAVRLLVFTVFPDASCCLVAFSSRGCISKVCLYATWLLCMFVIMGSQLAACCTACCVVLHDRFTPVIMHLACVCVVAFPLQPGQQSSCACCLLRLSFLVYPSMHSRAGVQAGQGLTQGAESRVVATFLDCVCPCSVAWMPGLSGTCMGL